VTTLDFRDTKHGILSTLYGTTTGQTKSRHTIPDVVGDIDVLRWKTQLVKECHAHVVEVDEAISIPTNLRSNTVISIELPAPAASRDERRENLMQNEAIVATVIDMLPGRNFTVLYTTSTGIAKGEKQKQKPEVKEYESEMLQEQLMHVEMKRDLHAGYVKREGTYTNVTLPKGGLVEKYTFVGPGMFFFSLPVLFLETAEAHPRVKRN
jgi:hypothetical protein